MFRLIKKLWKKELDIKTKLDIFVTFLASSISIIFIIVSYIFEDYRVHILSVLIIILPTIYIIGNLFIRDVLNKEIEDNKLDIDDLNSSIEIYDETLVEKNEEIKELKKQIRILKSKAKK